MTAPDAKTLIIALTKPWVGLLSNLIPISIIPKDSYAEQKDHPIGSGPFKFVSYDSSQGVVDLVANPDYWQGPPKISALRVRVISDTNALQAELQAGRVDMSPLPTSLLPDSIKQLGQNPNLNVHQFNGSNLVLLTFNTSSAPMDNVRVRQAVCYAIDREKMISASCWARARLHIRYFRKSPGPTRAHKHILLIPPWRKSYLMKQASKIRTVTDRRCVFQSRSFIASQAAALRLVSSPV